MESIFEFQGNPIRALTESISFGRFMSESLAWEKWSTFSHNRYLEEVEQFSKPGSVAQKKAYFEAHYKKRAAMKAAALLEQANTASNSASEVEAADEAPSTSRVNLEFSKATNDMIINEQDEGVEGDEEKGEKNVEVENSIQLANSKQIENAEECDITVAMPQEKMPEKVSCHSNQETAEKENVALPNNKRQTSSSSKSSSQSRASNLPKSSAKMSSSTRLRAETNATPNSKKSAGELVDKKRVTPKSIYMSINFASSLQDSSNKSSHRVSKDRSTIPDNPTRGSVHGVSKLLPSIFRHSQDRRTNSELNKSVSGKITVGGISETLSSDITAPRNLQVQKEANLDLHLYPLHLALEKLGEKNNAKEGTEQKHLQARPKEKAEYDLKKLRQSAVFRGKASHDLHRGLQSPNNSMKKVRLVFIFMTSLWNDVDFTVNGARIKLLKFAIYHVLQIPLTRPRSPKLGRKSTPNVTREASLQLHQRPSVNAENSKAVIQKSNHSSTRSVTLLPKKKAHENASPNIQRFGNRIEGLVRSFHVDSAVNGVSFTLIKHRTDTAIPVKASIRCAKIRFQLPAANCSIRHRVMQVPVETDMKGKLIMLNVCHHSYYTCFQHPRPDGKDNIPTQS
ncbi:unnamed protein product [Dovyalis caffra]|uniref:TPX2 C-terminal domain-containing protein n=1 Tax=Dovyalis caffra TaxID=77055 RepID=A0AAV1REH0_9ROSI|nr:unnamed protein product [Dovyalis caffra]